MSPCLSIKSLSARLLALYALRSHRHYVDIPQPQHPVNAKSTKACRVLPMHFKYLHVRVHNSVFQPFESSSEPSLPRSLCSLVHSCKLSCLSDKPKIIGSQIVEPPYYTRSKIGQYILPIREGLILCSGILIDIIAAKNWQLGSTCIYIDSKHAKVTGMTKCIICSYTLSCVSTDSLDYASTRIGLCCILE